jgi:hypothetical protein
MNNKEIVEKLLRYYPNINFNLKTFDGSSILHTASKYHPDLLEILLSNKTINQYLLDIYNKVFYHYLNNYYKNKFGKYIPNYIKIMN